MLNDRGIIKWLPFDALNGFTEAITNLKQKKSKIERPILSEDQKAELNYTLTQAVCQNQPISIRYYKKGHIYTVQGEIEKVNYNDKTITIEKNILSCSNILHIIILNTC